MYFIVYVNFEIQIYAFFDLFTNTDQVLAKAFWLGPGQKLLFGSTF